MDPQTATIVGAVIGGFLSAGAGVALDFFRERGRQKRARSLLVTAICDDLQHSIGLYDKYEDVYSLVRLNPTEGTDYLSYDPGNKTVNTTNYVEPAVCQ